MGLRIDPVVFAPAVALFAKAWCRTLRLSVEGMEPWLRLRSQGQSLVAAIWHDEMFPMIYLHRDQGVVAVISQSRDGEFVSQVVTRFGFKLARGSSRRGGVAALVSARKEMREHQADIVVTVDGPRGPRHKVKEGVIYLAARTGAPILPIRVFMSRSFVFRKAWDRFQLPWPGSLCRVVYGEPYHVPREQTSESLQAECLRLEQVLNAMK
jgi:lysophospholipid acyltransferase (LPLAT)-like uncharacterized protein